MEITCAQNIMQLGQEKLVAALILQSTKPRISQNFVARAIERKGIFFLREWNFSLVAQCNKKMVNTLHAESALAHQWKLNENSKREG